MAVIILRHYVGRVVLTFSDVRRIEHVSHMEHPRLDTCFIDSVRGTVRLAPPLRVGTAPAGIESYLPTRALSDEAAEFEAPRKP
jgi:hypothetical protein